MAKGTTIMGGIGLFLLTMVCYGCCENDDEDWSLGCFKQNTSEWHFNITAADYDPLVNMTATECVVACSDLDIGVKTAGLTANGVCLCSERDSEAISLYKVQNILCNYPLSDRVYFKVFPVADMPSLDVPSSGKALQTFEVKVNSSADSNCTYTLNFDDGLMKSFPKGDLTMGHYYASAGKYKITLSSHVRCLPRVVSKIVSIKSVEFSNVSLNCPEFITSTEEASCNITVAQGSDLNVTDKNAKFISTMPDTIMQTIGSPPFHDPSMILSLSNGTTYVMPFMSTFYDGYVTGFKMDIVPSGNITLQILSPVCTDGKPCQGGCIRLNERCSQPKIDINKSADCSGTEATLSTKSDNSTKYKVRAEFTWNSTETSHPYRSPLSDPVPIKRGDVIAFHVSAQIVAAVSNHSISYVLIYCNKKFAIGDAVTVSDGKKHQNIQFGFRVYVTTPSVLDIPIQPRIPPRTSLEYNVSSAAVMGNNEVTVKAVVEIQDKISGLKILAPEDKMYYATLEPIVFSFNVTNGTNVNFTVNFGDGSESQSTTLYHLNHTYQKRGNYTFTVTAWNRVSSENKSSIVAVVEDIRNLTFVKDPKTHPGIVGKPYEISFSLEAGDKPIFQLDFGNNKTLFFSCNNFVNDTITRNTRYTKPGHYTITIFAFSLVKRNESITSNVTIMEPIQNLTVYQRIEGELQLIKDNVITLFADQSLTLQANVSSGWPVSYEFNASEPVGTVHTKRNNPATFTITATGRWSINVMAFNDVSKNSTSFYVERKSGCEWGVELVDQRSKTEPFRTIRSMDIRFNTRQKPMTSSPSNKTCELPKYFCWKFNWTLFDDKSKALDVNYERNKKFFFIGKKILPPGRYKVKMSAVCNATGNRSKAETYFIIEAAKPVAVILGGYKRDVVQPRNGSITLDASTSYIPDRQKFNASGLAFSWSCVSNNTELPLLNNNTAKVTIDVSSLTVGSTLNVTLVVSYEAITGITIRGNTTQIIHIVNDSVPVTEIICRVNCLPYVIPTDRLSLESRWCFPVCDADVHFNWTLFKNEEKLTLTDSSTTTGVHKPNFVLNADVLKYNTKYKVELVSYRNNVQSLSTYPFRTSGELTGGKCKIKPDKGRSAETKFKVNCWDWEATYSPLTYAVRYQSGPVWILWYHGEEQVSSESTLPAGLVPNYTVPITVEIEGRYGEYAKKQLLVKVNPRQVGGNELNEKVNKLNRINAEEEPQKLVQEVLTWANVLNKQETNDSTRINNKEIRNTLVEQLSKVPANTLPLIQQTSEALKSAINTSTQVASDTQKTAAKTLKKMSETLLSNASDPGKREGKEIDDTGKIMLSALSKALKASLYTGQDTSKKNAPKNVIPNLYGTFSKRGKELREIGKKTAEVVKDLDETIERISGAMARNKLDGEKPTVISESNFEIKLSKNWRHGKDNYTTQSVNRSNDFASIRLPRNEIPRTEGIFTEMIVFNKNPYTWDIENAHYIQPNVVSFTFRDENGKKLPLRNLSEEIEIVLPNSQIGIVHEILNNSAEGNFLLYNFRIIENHYDEHILINIRNKNKIDQISKATFYLKFGEKVSEKSYDFKHSLGKNCQNCSNHPIDIKKSTEGWIVFIKNRKKLKCANGKVSVGILPCPAAKKTECDLKKYDYTIFLQTVSCRYWNHSKWIKDGCRVGHKSTPFRTSCLCNHLTAFSSYIVKPNPLNKFSAEDFRRGYVSFTAVVFIFTVYFIFLLWARRADRADCTKQIGVCPLADNRPQDRYRYEIAIWTGMRRNAGTNSEVTIILSGDKQDTEARCLVNPNGNGFARGSLEKFVLSTPQDLGSLYCIRMWHDNSRGSWYLSRVMVTDLQNEERYYFICDRWLAVDEDDGMVERLLPVASDEELADFHHLFYSRTKRGLSDTHLWVSVLNRPPQSLFTRVQRLSCCLCVVMTTMLANAMFYNTRSEPKPNSTNFIGSYSFTWDEVYIGVISSLIVVPINMIILYIFRNVRPKPRSKVRSQSKISMQSLGSGYHKIHHSQTSLGTLETSSDRVSRDSIPVDTANIYSRVSSPEVKKKKREHLSVWTRFKRFVVPSSLPHWFVYFAWVILVLATLGSATVVILYGMQFGNGRSLQWLFSIVVSICEDIFVLQPIKVLAVALGFALLIKKPDEGEFQLSSGDYEDEDPQHGSISGLQNETPEKKMPSSPRIPVRPSEEQLAVMRKARMKERKMFFLIQEIVVHLIFTIIIVLVTYGHKDTRSVHLFRHMNKLSTTTEKIHNFTAFWNWSRRVLIPKAFPETIYNGDDVPSYGFFDDGYNNLISRARMRLLRVKNDSCNIADEFKGKINICLKDYSLFDQDEECYREYWNSSKKAKRDSPWCFQHWKKLDGYPFWGRFHTYSGSGYINELTPGEDNNKTANDLEAFGWLNEQARALFVEFTTYNVNINLYTSITLLFEFPEFGGVFYFRNIIPMRLKLYVGGFAFFIFACEMIFLLFIAGYLYIAAKKLYRNKMAYFKNFWNLIDFAILLASLVAIGFHAYRITITSSLMREVKDRNGEFVNFQFVTYWSEALSCTMAIVVALTTVKLTKLMRFNLRISLFGKTLHDAKPALAMFGIQFFIVFFAYVMVGVLVFGYNVAQFKNILSAMLALGRVILGKSQFRELFMANAIIGPLFFFTYVMFVCWILITMFVAILTDSYHNVQDRCFGMSNEYEIVDFLLARFRAWSGIGGKRKKVPADQRWRQARIKVKAAATLGRQQSYIQSAENLAFEKTGDLMEKLEDSLRLLEKRVQDLSLDFEV